MSVAQELERAGGGGWSTVMAADIIPNGGSSTVRFILSRSRLVNLDRWTNDGGCQ